jgi:hypothetical protein
MAVAHFLCQVAQIDSGQFLPEAIHIDVIVAQGLHFGEFDLHVLIHHNQHLT